MRFHLFLLAIFFFTSSVNSLSSKRSTTSKIPSSLSTSKNIIKSTQILSTSLTQAPPQTSAAAATVVTSATTLAVSALPTSVIPLPTSASLNIFTPSSIQQSLPTTSTSLPLPSTLSQASNLKNRRHFSERFPKTATLIRNMSTRRTNTKREDENNQKNRGMTVTGTLDYKRGGKYRDSNNIDEESLIEGVEASGKDAALVEINTNNPRDRISNGYSFQVVDEPSSSDEISEEEIIEKPVTPPPAPPPVKKKLQKQAL
ncbi:hypothetical protein HDU92_004681 [Lobulomyces angularis]|nr:hypothetical protein HDU92_004681 [Lobulomyces angularis]